MLVGLTEVIGATETGGIIIPCVVSIIQVRNNVVNMCKCNIMWTFLPDSIDEDTG